MWKNGSANEIFTYPITFTNQLAPVSSVDYGVVNVKSITLSYCNLSSYNSGTSSIRFNLMIMGY